jgi:RNA polymerase sigma factor (sigma-70 family)
LARRHGLPRDQVDDAQQEAVWSVLEAIDAYGLPSDKHEHGASFRTFLGRVVQLRFFDFVRYRRRAKRHLERLIGSGDNWSGKKGQESHGGRSEHKEPYAGTDAEGREFREQLEGALSELDAQSRWLWEQSVAGASLHSLASQLGLPYHAVRYQYRKVRAHLAIRLKAWDVGEAPPMPPSGAVG